jgi:hypothetical protein
VLGAVDRLDHAGGAADAGEREVRVVGAGRVEVDRPDPQEPVHHALLGVHVLDAIDARLLDLLGEDPALDAQALVGDRVDGRDPPDEPDQHHGRRPDHDHAAHETALDSVADRSDERDDAGEDEHRQQRLQIEAEDRPPGRVALEDDPLAVVEVDGGTISRVGCVCCSVRPP